MRFRYSGLAFAAAVAGVLCAPAFAADDVATGAAGKTSATYTKDIAPMIEAHCGECHHPAGIGPFSLNSYRQVRGWSKMIKEVVLDGRMPPWHADPHVGQWKNDRSLSQEQKNTLVSWIDGGMPQGDPADLPEEVSRHNEWRIGEPDVVFEMPEEVTIDPAGVVPYMYFETKTDFEEDVWVSSMECLPGNPKVVHHIIMFVSAPGEGLDFGDDEAGGEGGSGFLDAFAPGGTPQALPQGQARRIPKGSSLIWQVHYTPTGKVETDRSRFGIKFATGPINYEMRTGNAINTNFEIPPRADSYKVESYTTFTSPATLMSLAPHMHYRGKSFEYYLETPDGKKTHLLSVPKYDFNWQTTYDFKEPVVVPAGSKMHCIAHFDNSDKNPYNPDPEKTVRWGDQTWEEMMIGFFHYSTSVEDNAISGD
jgi:hypothetical protein